LDGLRIDEQDGQSDEETKNYAGKGSYYWANIICSDQFR
jgi:hypothetical protein